MDAGTTIPELFLRTAARHGSRPAVIGREPALTYDELRQRVFRAAATLLSTGVKKGDRVAIWLPNGPEWIEAGLATALIGAIAVPISTRLKGDRDRLHPAEVAPDGRDRHRRVPRRRLHAPAGRAGPPAASTAWFRVGRGDARWTDWTSALSSASEATWTPRCSNWRAIGQTDRRRGDHVHVGHDAAFRKGRCSSTAQIVRAYSLWAERLAIGARRRQLPHRRADVSLVRLQGRRDRERCRRCGRCIRWPVFDAAEVLQIIETRGHHGATGGPPTIYHRAARRAPQRRSATCRSLRARRHRRGNVVPVRS